MTDQTQNPTRIRILHTEEQEAARLGFKQRTLRMWRVKGEGPPFLKVAGSVRYNPDAVDAWITEQTAKDQAERAAARGSK